jgi:hypothetical protein
MGPLGKGNEDSLLEICNGKRFSLCAMKVKGEDDGTWQDLEYETSG